MTRTACVEKQEQHINKQVTRGGAALFAFFFSAKGAGLDPTLAELSQRWELGNLLEFLPTRQLLSNRLWPAAPRP
jgi:hypothetical protein